MAVAGFRGRSPIIGMTTPTTATTKAPASSSSSMTSSGNFLLGGVQRIRAPTPQDVLCGRGGAVNHHRGNILFRQYCAARKHDYYSAKNKKEKLVIALEVVQLVRAGGDSTSTSTHPSPPRGRFLTKDASSSVLGAHGGHWWIEVEETKAIAKTSQALREGASKIRSEEHTSITTNSNSNNNSHINNTMKSGRFVGNENTSVLLKKRKRGTMTAVSPFPKTVSIESLALSSAAARTSTTASSFLNSTFEDYNFNNDNATMMDELYNNVEQARLMDDEIVVDRGIFDEEAHDLAELALDHEENYNNKKHKSDHPHPPVLQQQLQHQYSIVTTTDTNPKNSSNFVVAPLISNKEFATKYRTSSSTTSSDKNKINMIVTPPLVAVNAAAPAHDYINAIPTLCLDTTTTATTDDVPPTATVTLKQQEQQLSRRPSVAALHTLLHVDMTTLMGNEGYDFVNPFQDE